MLPAEFLATHNIPVEFLAPSKLRNCDARCVRPAHYRSGAVRVQVQKGLESAREAWCLWHEAVHCFDTMKANARGELVSYPCVAGYGAISVTIARDLMKHEEFIRSFRDQALHVTYGGISRDIDAWIDDPSTPPALRSQMIARRFNHRMRLLRYFSAATELFAEAVACAICEPDRFDRGAPGLRAVLRAALAPYRFPL